MLFCSKKWIPIFSDVTIEGFEFVTFYESCNKCRKRLELDEDEDKNCPFCGAKDVIPGRAMRYVLVIDHEGETHRLQGFMDSIECYLPKCEEDEMDDKLNQLFENKTCKITYKNQENRLRTEKESHDTVEENILDKTRMIIFNLKIDQ